MPTCPHHKLQLIKVKRGLSLVCPVCEYKAYDRSKFWLPEIRHVIDLPTASAWSNWTMQDVEESGVNIVLSSGKLIGTAVSPQIINLTRHTDRYWDCTKVKIDWTHTVNNGKVKYYASNDGGTTYRHLRNEEPATWELNHGQEQAIYKQTKYNDLRIKIEITRNATGDTSPAVSRVIVKHNKIKL